MHLMDLNDSSCLFRARRLDHVLLDGNLILELLLWLRKLPFPVLTRIQHQLRGLPSFTIIYKA